MKEIPEPIWTAACAHRLQKHWRTVDPTELEVVAAEIWHDPRLRQLSPEAAAVEWLRPLEPRMSSAG
jgi:hypothetical protein